MINNMLFIDTNLLIYLYSTDPKSRIVENLVHDHFHEICISTQVLNELYSVLTRKNLKTKTDAQSIINDLIDNYTIYCLDEDCIQHGISININHHFSYWDSLIISAALESGCSTLYSEDLQHGQVIEEILTILNPFLIERGEEA
jgi:predicted nucleic acid-binding protein